MKKIISIIFVLLVSSNAYAGGLIGIKVGQGELEGNKAGYTAGTTNYAASSGDKSNEYGAIFAEINLGDTPISIGLEHIPFEANIRLDGAKETDTGATIDNANTLYLLAAKELGNCGSAYIKAGLFSADIGTIKNTGTTVNSQDSTLEGNMVGLGFQSPEIGVGLVVRGEATLTDLDDVSVTTSSNGSASVKKTADGELTTFSISVAKKF